MIAVGIDLGTYGAMAMTDHNSMMAVADLPIIDVEGDKRISGRGMLDILREWVPPGEPCILVVENVRPRPSPRGTTMHSEGQLMRFRGSVEAMSDIAGQPITWAHPQTWKRHYGLINKAGPDKLTPPEVKEASRQKALVLFPRMAPALARKMDHNRAEALLLAHWGLAMKT